MFQIFNEKQHRYGLNNGGLSILEVLIAVAIVSFVFIPVIEILYSIQPKSILDILSGSSLNIKEILFSNSESVDFTAKKQSFERGDLMVVQSKGGVWKPYTLSNTLFTRQSCTDFSLSRPTSTLAQLYIYTKEELGISTTTVLTGAAIIGQKLYLSGNSSSTTEPDMFSYNINLNLYNATNIFRDALNINTIRPALSLIQTKDTGPGISSLQVKGTNIITSNTSVKSQADILDQDFLKKVSYTIPGSNSNTTPLTKVVLYTNKFLIVGTEKSILPEVHVFDIKTGQVLYSIETGYGINDLVLYGNFLIVAGPRDPEIEVFYITKDFENEHFKNDSNVDDSYNFMSGQKISQYDLPGGSGNAKTLAVFGDNLYVGRTKGGNELTVLSMINSQRSITFKDFTNKKIGWSIDSMLNFEKYTLVFSADEYKEFQLYELNNMGNFLMRLALDLPARVNSALCFKNTIWVTFKDLENMDIRQSGSLPALGLIVL